jgi:hypothetical protein
MPIAFQIGDRFFSVPHFIPSWVFTADIIDRALERKKINIARTGIIAIQTKTNNVSISSSG